MGHGRGSHCLECLPLPTSWFTQTSPAGSQEHRRAGLGPNSTTGRARIQGLLSEWPRTPGKELARGCSRGGSRALSAHAHMFPLPRAHSSHASFSRSLPDLLPAVPHQMGQGSQPPTQCHRPLTGRTAPLPVSGPGPSTAPGFTGLTSAGGGRAGMGLPLLGG